MENGKSGRTSNFWAITPILFFIVLFLGSGIVCARLGYEKPFSQFPACLGAYTPAGVLFHSERVVFRKVSVDAQRHRPAQYRYPHHRDGSGGAPLWRWRDACGGVDSVVGLCLNYMPTSVVTAGFFVIGCIVSFASGSTISTVAALAPIALSVAAGAGISLPVMVGSVMALPCSANSMSPISDCTIVSNSVMGLGAGERPQGQAALPDQDLCHPLCGNAGVFALFGRPNGQVTLGTYEVNFAAILPLYRHFDPGFHGLSILSSLSAAAFSWGCSSASPRGSLPCWRDARPWLPACMIWPI